MKKAFLIILSLIMIHALSACENAKNADGFVKITDLKASHRTRVSASICEECRTVVLKY